MLRLLDLFAGIGGFSLGLESTGFFKTIAFCEKDEFCKKVLKKHWTQIPIYDDIKTINAGQISADIVSGGFPCQPFSNAGKQRGKQDDRYLWPEMLRVVTEVKPRWFIGENVSGLININEGMVLRQVCDDLEKQSFQVQCFVIPASGIGAWHQRKRVWIIGHNEYVPNSNKQGLERLNEQSTSIKTNQMQTNFRSKNCSQQNTLWHTESTRREGSINRQRERQLRRASSSREQCKKTWWEVESEFCGVPHGLSSRLDKDRNNRIKSLGNSIVPQIAREIGLAIMEAENGN